MIWGNICDNMHYMIAWTEIHPNLKLAMIWGNICDNMAWTEEIHSNLNLRQYWLSNELILTHSILTAKKYFPGIFTYFLFFNF